MMIPLMSMGMLYISTNRVSLLNCEDPCSILESILSDQDAVDQLKAKHETFLTFFTKEGVLTKLLRFVGLLYGDL